MGEAEREQSSWREYYSKVPNRLPRDLLSQVSEWFVSPGTSIDLGCGGGVETRELLRRGWDVVAIDQEATAIGWVTGQTSTEEQT